MSKSKNSSHHAVFKKVSNSTRGKVINSHGYNISNFNVLDMSVRRESGTGRLVSTNRQSSKKNIK